MSAPVSAITRRVQVGVETTRGTAVAANKVLQATSIRTRPKIETESFRPHGNAFPTIITPGMDWTEGEIEGKGSYTDLAYLLACIMSYAAPVQIGATTGYTWTFAPSPLAIDTVKSLTIEEGIAGAGNAKKVAGLQVNEFALEFSRKAVDISGSVFGLQTVTGQTLTASPADVALKPILAKHGSVYMDTSWAALGTTKLLDTMAGKVSLGDRFSPWWPVNAANSSYANVVQGVPSTGVSLRMANNAVGQGHLTDLRSGGTKFIRLEWIGDNIGVGADYKLWIDIAAKYTDSSDEEEDENALVIEPPMEIVYDSTSGKAIQFTLVNELSTL